MTHDGPQSSATAIDKTTRMHEDSDIIFGSPFLYKLIKNDKGDRIVANVHGHAHDGASADKITDGVRVFNPGSLKYGEFASLRLTKESGHWKVTQYYKHYLN